MSTRRIFHGKARNNPRLFSHENESSENEGIRGIKRKQQIQHLQYFTTKLPIAGKAVAILSWRSCCFGCLPCRRIVYTRSVFCPREAVPFHGTLFSPWHNLSKLSSAHGLSKELLLVVKVVLVVSLLSRLHRNNTIQL